MTTTPEISRFYPDTIPPFAHEPTPEKFAIVDCGHQGRGIIAKVAFAPQQIVCQFQGITQTQQSLYTLQIKPGLYLYDPYFMGYILHHCDPNTRCDMTTLTFTALKPIQPNELITMDYETTEDELFQRFHCGCSAAHCRGYIQGRKR